MSSEAKHYVLKAETGYIGLAMEPEVEAEPEEPKEEYNPENTPPLAALVRTRIHVQRMRIAATNALKATERGASAMADDALEYISNAIQAAEDMVDQAMVQEAEQLEIYDWLEGIKGIGPAMASMVLGLITIEKAPTVSSLWKYAGLSVEDGEADRRRAGKKLGYNPVLKSRMYLISSSLLIHNKAYKDLYAKYKEMYLEKGWTKKRADLAARRIISKTLLSHLWTVWRDLEGLPVSYPYAKQILDLDVSPPWFSNPTYEYPKTITQLYKEERREWKQETGESQQ